MTCATARFVTQRVIVCEGCGSTSFRALADVPTCTYCGMTYLGRSMPASVPSIQFAHDILQSPEDYEREDIPFPFELAHFTSRCTRFGFGLVFKLSTWGLGAAFALAALTGIVLIGGEIIAWALMFGLYHLFGLTETVAVMSGGVMRMANMLTSWCEYSTFVGIGMLGTWLLSWHYSEFTPRGM